MNTVINMVTKQVRLSHQDETQINVIYYKTKKKPPLEYKNCTNYWQCKIMYCVTI